MYEPKLSCKDLDGSEKNISLLDLREKANYFYG